MLKNEPTRIYFDGLVENLCFWIHHWHRDNLPYYEATMIDAFVWGVVVGWVAHALWVFMIRPIIREAKKNEHS